MVHCTTRAFARLSKMNLLNPEESKKAYSTEISCSQEHFFPSQKLKNVCGVIQKFDLILHYPGGAEIPEVGEGLTPIRGHDLLT